MSLRNVAIIAHVDHGKTTLVDGLLKQSRTFRDNEAAMGQTLIMDSNDQERERGITILAKNTAVQYGETKINIIDTPGHADFGGEVERILNMADGAVLVIDAQEGPMPQTKFVLKKALGLGLKIIVVVNKIDKPASRIEEVLHRTYDLFLDLATEDDQLEFPILYAIGREGKAWKELPEDINAAADLAPLFETIIESIPAPKVAEGEGLQMLVTTLDRDTYLGTYAIGRIQRGTAKAGQSVVIMKQDGTKTPAKIEKVFTSQGLKRLDVPEAFAGDIVALAGVQGVSISDTVCDPAFPEALPAIAVEEPTMRMAVGANTSPLAGREGTYVTSRHLFERMQRELETNIALRLEVRDNGDYVLSGRGELHLSVFLETLRREGYEMQVGKPEVVTREIDGVLSEPIEELTVDVSEEYAGSVTSEIGRRRGLLLQQEENGDGSVRLVFEITTRGLLGLRNQLLTVSRGTAVMNSLFLRWEKSGGALPKLRNGVLIASEAGKAITYGLNVAQGRGTTFILPQTEVYAGMIIGLNSREDDLEINVTKERKLTNVRSNAEIAVILIPPTQMSLEQSLDFIEDDELLEITPKSLRMRKRLLDLNARAKAKKAN